MQHNYLAGKVRPLWRTAIMTLAAAAYLLSLAGVAWTTGPGDALVAVALLVLGVAVGFLTLRHIPAAPPRLGGQAQALWRRQQWLAMVSIVTVYLALVLGALVTSIGGLWTCTTLPLCAPFGDPPRFALIHRGAAATASILVGWLALWVLGSHAQRSARRAGLVALGLMVAQNLVGLGMVVAARGGEGLPLSIGRFAHLAVGGFTWSAVVALATIVVRVPPARLAPTRTTAAETGARPGLLKDYISLTKPGVISLLIFTTLVGMLITPAGVPSLGLIGWTMLGGWLMPAGAHALNCYFDRDIDGKMGRTGRRPIPSGRIPAWHALALGLTLGVVAFAILAVFVNLLTAVVALVGYIYYAVVYTIVLKRHSVHNIVIGGGAGSIPPLVGWAAVTGSLTWASLLLFAVIFYWTPPHFWALALIRRSDYANAGVPMLPVVAGDAATKRHILIYTIIMVGFSLVLTPAGLMGWSYWGLALALGLVFVGYVLRMMRHDTTATRWALYRFSLLYLFLLFVAM
ncbi:MAG: protoheme IX farnesyltransferase, partial [Chloroflexi bacterium]